MLKTLDHVNIVVSDLQQAKSFFTAIGFRVEHEGDLRGDWVSKIVGLKNVEARYAQLSLHESRTKLELIEYVSPPSEHVSSKDKANQLGFRHMAFEVENIDTAVSKLTELGVEFLSPVQTYEPTSKRLVYFYGPDGILLELAQYESGGNA